jgi:hypothetical protein
MHLYRDNNAAANGVNWPTTLSSSHISHVHETEDGYFQGPSPELLVSNPCVSRG